MHKMVLPTSITLIIIHSQLLYSAYYAFPLGTDGTVQIPNTMSQNESSNCFDLGHNCHLMKNLCNNATFESMLRRECALTCNHCEPEVNIEEILMPNIQTEMPPFLQGNDTHAMRATSSSSLSKSIIRGTCFDEYIYCGEFRALCDQEIYQEIMARHCALSCGRCEVQHKERETCVDHIECSGLAPLCHHPVYRELLAQQCRATCNICTAELDGCKDRHKNCPAFKNDGFCENPVYTENERKYLCGLSCGLCEK